MRVLSVSLLATRSRDWSPTFGGALSRLHSVNPPERTRTAHRTLRRAIGASAALPTFYIAAQSGGDSVGAFTSAWPRAPEPHRPPPYEYSGTPSAGRQLLLLPPCNSGPRPAFANFTPHRGSYSQIPTRAPRCPFRLKPISGLRDASGVLTDMSAHRPRVPRALVPARQETFLGRVARAGVRGLTGAQRGSSAASQALRGARRRRGGCAGSQRSAGRPGSRRVTGPARRGVGP